MGEAGTALNEQLVTAGTALAGLILVFLGSTLAAFEGYDATQRHSVKVKYQRRALVAFFGFLCSLSGATAGIVALLRPGDCWSAVGLTFLGLAFLLTLALAALVLSDLW
jgi:hypothetical protein